MCGHADTKYQLDDWCISQERNHLDCCCVKIYFVNNVLNQQNTKNNVFKKLSNNVFIIIIIIKSNLSITSWLIMTRSPLVVGNSCIDIIHNYLEINWLTFHSCQTCARMLKLHSCAFLFVYLWSFYQCGIRPQSKCKELLFSLIILSMISINPRKIHQMPSVGENVFTWYGNKYWHTQRWG